MSKEQKNTPSNKKSETIVQAEVNIGTIGHVDNGKSTLVQALSGKFPDTHSEELKRGISIRLGYADAEFRKCPQCGDPECYTTEKICPVHNVETELLRKVSFVDCPGHEILMATLLSGANIMDGAILLIAANTECPQPQTREHLAAMEILGISNIVIAQNKIELVSEEQAKKNYQQIKDFIKGTIAENAPIIPISAMHKANLDLLIKAIEENIPSPKIDEESPFEMHVARSFDINRPGTKPKKLRGAVLGGSIKSGVVRVGDEIEIVPGLSLKKGKKTEYVPIKTKVVSIAIGDQGFTDVAHSGGLVGLGTDLDPSFARADKMSGNIVTSPGHSPPILSELTMKVQLMKYVVGSEEITEVQPLAKNETLMLNVGTAKTAGVITEIKGEWVKVKLTREISSRVKEKVAISRRIQRRFRLIGVGEIIDDK
ncbi:MAG: translation initiation factor IF-2 subunit gamma [Candidatus Heimdallarchaeum endolithica]|uniref:protein-synthesizing GTPase n=1 Tax=Candidatus Heimdallarchaeum endolithica TaxID=2876572 RepID=A0A9Y1BNX7_9ARCH|nr:MAG: translation initiation factor IF-2 subunit gamma [Candidatus Heimdallarchaeum endolithica]